MRKTVGLIGFPLGHTVSPAMHNAAFQQLKLDWEYVPLEVDPKDLASALQGFRALHFAGFNVTIPHKEAIVPLLDEVTKLARIIGAVNTVKNEEGKLIGYNTDGPGFIDSLREDAGFDPEGKRAVVLGAGGAARAVGVMLAENHAASIVFSDVLEEKAKSLAEYVGSLFKANSFPVSSVSSDLQKAIDSCQLLVNASPVGMHPNLEQSPLPVNLKIPKGVLVYDLVYNPSRTKLLKTAQASGAKACSGLGMLVRQGASAFTIWTGQEAPLKIMRQAAEEALRSG